MDLACAVVHGQPPLVYAAEDIDVLHRVIAIEVVASTPASALSPGTLDCVRQALLDERWGDAVELWMRAAGAVLDVYPDGLHVWTEGTLHADLAGIRLQFTPLFGH